MIIKNLGIKDYLPVWREMKAFTENRTEESDEIWILEHTPVFTQGQAGKKEHILQSSNIPIVQSDRGGQVTYHGPGQLIVYFLLNLRKNHFTIKSFICFLEQIIIDYLNQYNVDAYRKPKAPGVYVGESKIASLGLRVRKGFCYHGLSFNVDMDLTPFTYINPCGYNGLSVTQLKDLGIKSTVSEVSNFLIKQFDLLSPRRN